MLPWARILACQLSATAQTYWQLGQHSHLGPPWYNPPLCARSRPDPLGGYCHPNHIGQQTCVNPCNLPFAFPPTDWNGPNRLFRQGISGLDGWRPQRQTRGLELAAEHETGETPTWLCRRELLSDLWTRLSSHQPIQPLGYSRCPGHHDNQEPLLSGVSDFVLCTKPGPPPSYHWHFVLLILSPHTGSPWLQAHWMGQLPNSVGRTNSVQSGIAQRDGNRHMRWELLWRCSESSGGVNSQASPTWWPTTSGTGRHSGWYTPEKPAAEAVADHQGPHWKPRSNAFKDRWPADSTSGETTNGALHSNP